MSQLLNVLTCCYVKYIDLFEEGVEVEKPAPRVSGGLTVEVLLQLEELLVVHVVFLYLL